MGALLSALSWGTSAATAPLSALCLCFQGVSCVCSTVNLLSCCFKSAMGKNSGITPRTAKLFYVLVLGIATILAMILRFNSDDLHFGFFGIECKDSSMIVPEPSSWPSLHSVSYAYCKGPEAVFRISFVLTIFFSIMAVISYFSESFHRGFWIVKVLLLLGGLIGIFFVSEKSFNQQHYAWVARGGSVVFMLLQILILIDFAYEWNSDWVRRALENSSDIDDSSGKQWIYAILGTSFGMLALSLTGIVLLFIFYASCDVGIAFTTVTIISVIAIVVISLFRGKFTDVEFEGAILPTSVVCLYVVYLCWSSLQSNPDETCRPSAPQTTATILAGGLWATITLLWTTLSVTSNAGHLIKGENREDPFVTHDEEMGAPPVVRSEYAAIGTDLGEDDDEPIITSKEPAWAFHLIMVCASMYVSMLLTDWGTASYGVISSENVSMWVKISAQWVTSILFVWTLIAPAVLTDRDFS